MYGRLPSPNASARDALTRAAEAVARRELAEVDVDLATWRRAAAGAQDASHARQRYVRLRAAGLRRDLRAVTPPFVAADRGSRPRRGPRDPSGQTSLDAAPRRHVPLIVWYYVVVTALIALALWLAP